MERSQQYPPVSPLIHTLWSCRAELKTFLADPNANSCHHIRKRSTSSKVVSPDLYSKRIRLNDEGVPMKIDVNIQNYQPYERCHKSHDDPTDVELIQVLIGVVQDKRSFRLANAYSYSCRGNRRLRRMLSSMTQNVQERNLHNALNESYMRAAEIQNFTEVTMFTSSELLLDCGVGQFSTDSMESTNWYTVGDHFVDSESNTQQILGVDDATGGASISSSNWNRCCIMQNLGQFVPQETDLMDISRNTVTSPSVVGLDWGPGGFGPVSASNQRTLLITDRCGNGSGGDNSIQSSEYLFNSVGKFCLDENDNTNQDKEVDTAMNNVCCWESITDRVFSKDSNCFQISNWPTRKELNAPCSKKKTSSEKGVLVNALRSVNVDFKSIAGMA